MINAPNPNDILRKKVPQEWLDKATTPHGSFHDTEGNLVFYKLYSEPSWIAFTYADKASLKAYYNKSIYIFYLTVFVCLVILMTLFFYIPHTINRWLVSYILILMVSMSTRNLST